METKDKIMPLINGVKKAFDLHGKYISINEEDCIKDYMYVSECSFDVNIGGISVTLIGKLFSTNEYFDDCFSMHGVEKTYQFNISDLISESSQLASIEEITPEEFFSEIENRVNSLKKNLGYTKK